MMKTILSLASLCLTLLSDSLYAGSAPAEIQCSNKSAALYIKGTIPADEDTLDLTFTYKGTKRIITSKNTVTNVIGAFNHKVFTLIIHDNNGDSLILYGIPNTMKVSKPNHANRAIDAKFDAILESAPKPGYKGAAGYDGYLHNVRISCEYHYSI